MYTVRKAAPSDARSIAGIYVDSWRNTYAGLLPDELLVGLDADHRERRWWRHVLARRPGNHAAFVAEASGHGVVGFVSGGPARDRRFEYDRRSTRSICATSITASGLVSGCSRPWPGNWSRPADRLCWSGFCWAIQRGSFTRRLVANRSPTATAPWAAHRSRRSGSPGKMPGRWSPSDDSTRADRRTGRERKGRGRR